MTTHMRREVEEIPQAAARLLESQREPLREAGRRLREADPRFLITVARGSSDHASALLKYAVELTVGAPVASIGPSVASIYGARLKLADSACIAVSQSGKSPDIVAMADLARRAGSLTLALTNTPASPLGAGSELPIDIAAGPERSVAATKTFVNSALAGLAILAEWAQDQALRKAVETLPARLEEAIGCDWSAFADAVGDRDSLFVLGRGPALAIANEAALKFKETSAVHAESYSAAEVMHGPLALVEPGFPVLVMAGDDSARPSTLTVAKTLVDKGAAVFVTGGGVEGAGALPYAPTGHPLTDPLSLITSFYLLVEAFSRRRGYNPDEPRNLRKVTETV